MAKAKPEKATGKDAAPPAATKDAASERVYVTDEQTGQRFLAAAKGHQVPEWAQRMLERSGGASNAPARKRPEETA